VNGSMKRCKELKTIRKEGKKGGREGEKEGRIKLLDLILQYKNYLHFINLHVKFKTLLIKV
jgi:hypothetical protein